MNNIWNPSNGYQFDIILQVLQIIHEINFNKYSFPQISVEVEAIITSIHILIKIVSVCLSGIQ